MIHSEQLHVYISLIKEYGSTKALFKGKELHSYLINSGFDQHREIRNRIVQMYRLCGDLQEARNAFDRIRMPNETSWNIMISAYAQSNEMQEAKCMFDRMPRRDIVSWNSMIAGYCQNGHCQGAKIMFDSLPERIAMSWFTMMGGFMRHGDLENASTFFRSMPERNVVAWNSLISVHANKGHLLQSRRVFEKMPQTDVHTWTMMMAAFGQYGQLHSAKLLFDGMPEKNLVSWNAMITAYLQNEQWANAVLLFQCMDLDGVYPDEITLVSILIACVGFSTENMGRCIHSTIIDSDYRSDVTVVSSIINMYGKFGNTETAKNCFDKMPQRNAVTWSVTIGAYTQNGDLESGKNLLDKITQFNKVAWNTMLTAYAQNGYLQEAEAMFKMHQEPDKIAWNTMIGAYAQSGNVDQARNIFDKMPERNIVAWTVMIRAYSQNGHCAEALQLHKLMENDGVPENKVTFVSLLDACAGCHKLAEGKLLHSRILKLNVKIEGAVGGALVHMYGNCGSLVDARFVFDNLARAAGVISWTAMISSYVRNGFSKVALQLFQNMTLEGIEPNCVTFLSILSACSQAGVLNEARSYFRCMIADHGILPMRSHYSSLVDTFARVGQLWNAEDLIKNMPYEPDRVFWNCLVSASTMHGDVERGSRAGEFAIETPYKLDTDHDSAPSAPYVLLRNILQN